MTITSMTQRHPMPDVSQIIQASAGHAWFYLPVAVVLGALHALEPGHAKSLMAAYIISIRGTPRQAALLGLSAAVGHTIVVWFLAIVSAWSEAYCRTGGTMADAVVRGPGDTTRGTHVPSSKGSQLPP